MFLFVEIFEVMKNDKNAWILSGENKEIINVMMVYISKLFNF